MPRLGQQKVKPDGVKSLACRSGKAEKISYLKAPPDRCRNLVREANAGFVDVYAESGELAPRLLYEWGVWKGSQNEMDDAQPAPSRGASSLEPSASGIARLGSSIHIKGTLTGEEDLLIEGSVEGEVTLGKNKVTIGRSGRVKADIHGSAICVEGEVKGNLFGEDQVIIRQSGKVRGNVTAPRVNLENGAKFKGAIDMQPGTERATQPTSSSATSSKPVPSRGTAPPKVRQTGG